MTVYQLTIKGFNSDQPVGCVYKRGTEKFLATPYGDEPLTWLANKNGKKEMELLVEKTVTEEENKLYQKIAVARCTVFQLNKEILSLELQLDKLESDKSSDGEYKRIEQECVAIEKRIKSNNADSYKYSKELLGKHSTHLNHINFTNNLDLGTDVTINTRWGRNYFILDIRLPIEDEKEKKRYQKLSLREEIIYQMKGVYVRYRYLTVEEPETVRLELLVNLPEGGKPKLTEHLKPMQIAIENYLLENDILV